MDEVVDIPKACRGYMGRKLLQYLVDMPEETLRSKFDLKVSSDFDVFLTELNGVAFEALCDSMPTCTEREKFILQRQLRSEITRFLGQVSRSIDPKNPEHKTMQFQARVELIGNLYKDCKGKYESWKRDVTVQSGATSGQNAIISRSDPPSVKILNTRLITFIPSAMLGKGAFSTVHKGKVHAAGFSNDVYAIKRFLRGEGQLSKDEVASIEATSIHVQHSGIIAPIGLVRSEENPMVVYPYWNGGTLERWISLLRTDGSKPMTSQFLDIPVEIGTLEKFKAHLLQVINGLLQTVRYMHQHSILHNDLHGRNILIHFPTGLDEVYVGITDWGRSTSSTTTKHFLGLPDANPDTLTRWKNMYRFVAPECLKLRPPPFTKAQDVYSTFYHVDRLIDFLHTEDETVKVVQSHLRRTCMLGMAKLPEDRIRSTDITRCVDGLCRLNIPITTKSGLRPLEL